MPEMALLAIVALAAVWAARDVALRVLKARSEATGQAAVDAARDLIERSDGYHHGKHKANADAIEALRAEYESFAKRVATLESNERMRQGMR